MKQVACVQTHAFTALRRVPFDRIELVVPPGEGWPAGVCRFLGGTGGDVEIACRDLSAVSAEAGLFDVTVSDGGRDRYGPFSVQGLTTALPAGSDCFLFVEQSNGFWRGVTVGAAYGRLAVVAYACDPT